MDAAAVMNNKIGGEKQQRLVINFDMNYDITGGGSGFSRSKKDLLGAKLQVLDQEGSGGGESCGRGRMPL